MPRQKVTLAAVNQRLKASCCALRVEQRGDRLWLRGTLPIKPGHIDLKGRDRKQQKFALRIYANQAGLVEAEREAQRLGALLTQGKFDWNEVSTPHIQSKSTCGYWLKRFKADWVSRQTTNPEQTEYRWHDQFWDVAYKWLPVDQPLTDGLLRQVAERWKPDTRGRQVGCQKFQRLANFAEVPSTVREMQGKYKPQPRKIPTEKQIVRAIDAIQNPGWQWVFGAIACYGLRDHEAFLSEFVFQKHRGQIWLVSRVSDDTKTGAREVYPLRPEWCERWKLADVRRPNVTVKTNKGYGDRTSTQAQRYKLGFKPYDLRHWWNITVAVELRFDPSVGGIFAGNSARVNAETYRRHISEHVAKESWFEAVQSREVSH